MPRNSNRSRNNNPSGRNQYSSDWMDTVKDRPIAATAAAAIGLSLSVSIQSLLYWLRPDGLLLRLRLLFLGMGFSSSFR